MHTPKGNHLLLLARTLSTTPEYILHGDNGDGPTRVDDQVTPEAETDLIAAFVNTVRSAVGKEGTESREVRKARVLDAINAQIQAATLVGIPTGPLYELRLKVERDEPV